MAQAPLTMRKIAKMAKVSPTVVSHVLNRTPGAYVAASTRERVERVAQEAGYQQSLLVRSIKNPLRQLGIAVGMSDATTYAYTGEIFQGIRQEAFSQDYCPVIQALPTARGQTDCTAAVNKMANLHATRLIDGFVVDKQFFTTASIELMYQRQVPVVTVNGAPTARTQAGIPIPSIIIDDRLGAQIAVRHLLELGHRRIAMISPPYSKYPYEYGPYRIWQLILGYQDALKNAGMQEETIVEGDSTDKQSIATAVDNLFAMAVRPTALFVGDDMMALMVLRGLQKRRLRIPGDVSVIGYGDSSLGTLLAEPELTTIHAPFHQNGVLAAKTIIQMIESKQVDQPQVCLKPELIVRNTTAPPGQ